MSNSAVLFMGPCADCGSSDACASYDDGHTHCFSCGAHKNQGGTEKAAAPRVTGGMIESTPMTLGARKIHEDTCRKWDYGVGEYKGQKVQVANFKDERGRTVAQKIRTVDKKFVILGDAKAMGLYGKWLWRDGGRMVVVTEGELDALSMSQTQRNKYPVVSVPNGAQGAKGAVAKDLDWLEQYDSVVFMFDNDEHGKKAAVECAALLSPGKAKIAQLPEGIKDASEALVANRSADLVDAMWGAKSYRPDGIVDSDDLLAAVRARKDERAIAHFPLPVLQAKTRGLCRRQVVVVAAGSGMGKTEFTREMTYSFIKQGLRVGIVALEESTDRTALGLVGLELSCRLHLEEDPEKHEGFAAAWDAVIRDKVYCYDHFGSMDGDALISKMRYMRVALGLDVIILDHLSIVISGMEEDDERRTIDRIMTRIRSLAEETEAAIVVVSHLKRPTGTPHEEGGRTSLSQLRGSTSIGGLSDIAIGLERDQQDEEEGNITDVRILKNRRTGEVGLCDRMEYSHATGRMTVLNEFSVTTISADDEPPDF